jgi:hypothetical protein
MKPKQFSREFLHAYPYLDMSIRAEHSGKLAAYRPENGSRKPETIRAVLARILKSMMRGNQK